MKARLCGIVLVLMLAGNARGDLLAWFAWDSPQPVAGVAYVLGSFPVSHGPSYPDYVISTESGGYWSSPGDATLTELGKFEVWWTSGNPQYSLIGTLDVVDATVHQEWHGDRRLRYGVSLDWLLDGGDRGVRPSEIGTSLFSGERLVPKLGSVLFGYNLTHLERVVSPGSQRIEIHGAPISVPEPAAWMLIAVALIILAQAGVSRHGRDRQGWARHDSARHGRLGPSRLILARLGPARRGSSVTRAGLIAQPAVFYG